MRRGLDSKGTIDLMNFIRQEIPEISLRTTMLVGHPGETEEHFEELKNFVREFKFDRLGVFAYSEEEGTYAAKKFKDEISDEVKQQRVAELMEVQQQVSFEKNQLKVGKTFKTIIDREEADYYIGRTEFDAPEVDNEVLISKKNRKLKVGEFYNFKIASASEFDLYAETM